MTPDNCSRGLALPSFASDILFFPLFKVFSVSGFALTAEIEMKLFSSLLKALAMASERKNNENNNERVLI